jgi:hypothetical protein
MGKGAHTGEGGVHAWKGGHIKVGGTLRQGGAQM